MAMVVRRKEEWERIRSRGQQRFILRYGILGRGLPMALVCAVGIELYLGGTFPEALRAPAFLGRFLFALAVFSLGGSLTARMTWKLYERRFGPRAAP
jgi:hypothetical protein